MDMPKLARCSAVAAPNPLDAPVMMAVLDLIFSIKAFYPIRRKIPREIRFEQNLTYLAPFILLILLHFGWHVACEIEGYEDFCRRIYEIF